MRLISRIKRDLRVAQRCIEAGRGCGMDEVLRNLREELRQAQERLPRIFLVQGVWVCSEEKAYGMGATAREAYVSWLALVIHHGYHAEWVATLMRKRKKGSAP